MVLCIAYSPQGDQVASASHDKTVRLWNATTGDHQGTLKGHTNEVTSVAYSPDGEQIATGDRGGIIMLWNVETLTLIHTLEDHKGYVRDVVFSPQGDQLASAGNDWTVHTWDVVTGECCSELTGHRDVIESVAYSHKGDLLASGSRDKTVLIWDVKTGQCRAQIQNLQRGVLCVAWIPSTDDAYYLVTGCEDGVVLKWRITGEEGQCQVTPCWIATRGSLTATKALIEGVRGLSSAKERLLKQCIDEGEPVNPARKASNMRTITGPGMLSNRPLIRASPRILTDRRVESE
jgi:WD40 repeat protein